MEEKILKDRIDYSKKLCKEMANNHGNFIFDLINDLEAINFTRCCEKFETDEDKDAFDEGYKKGWEDGISVQ